LGKLIGEKQAIEVLIATLDVALDKEGLKLNASLMDHPFSQVL
jgi:hypothetical protein